MRKVLITLVVVCAFSSGATFAETLTPTALLAGGDNVQLVPSVKVAGTTALPNWIEPPPSLGGDGVYGGGVIYTDPTWGNTATDFNDGASWVGGVAPGTSDIGTFSSATTFQPNVTANISIAGLDFTTTGWDLTSSSASIKLTLLSTSTTNGTAAISIASGGGTNTIDAPLILGAAGASTQTFAAASGTTLVLNGVISSTNSITLSLSSTGTIKLNGANTYTGTTSWVNAGNTTILGNSGAFGTSTINFNQNNTIRAGVDLTGANKITNAITLANSATLTFGNTLGFNLEFSGNVDMGGAARTLTSNTGTTFFDGIISNDGGGGLTLTTVSGGIFALAGTNTYTGATTINGTGKVSVATIGNGGSNGPIGSGSTIIFGIVGTAGGTLQYTGSGETTNRAISLAGNNGTGGGVEASGSGALVLSGTFTNSGTVNKTFVLSGTSTAANEMQSVIGNGGSSTTSLTKSGAGTWILSGTNTYTGNTAISGGTLSVSSIGNFGGSGNLGAGTTFNLGSSATSGTLLYTGTGETTDKNFNLSGTTGGGTIDQSGTGLLKITGTNAASGPGIKTLTLQGSTAGTGEISGTIVNNSASNTTAVVKNGTGTWTLSGATPNTYSGGTAINAGTFIGGADGAFGTGNVSLTAGAVTLTLQNGAMQTYIASTATLSYVNTDIINLNYAGSDTVMGLTVDGVAQGPGTYGAGATNPDGVFTGTGFIMVVVPEPGTIVMFGLGLGLLAGVNRFRHRRS